MEIREATTDDIEGIRAVAHESLLASYTPDISEDIVEHAAEVWYGDEFSDELESDNAVILVAIDGDEVVAFSQNYIVGDDNATGDINWLHVHPDHRGSGLGTRLLERTEQTLVDNGASLLRGRVLEANETGGEFYVAHGYEEGEGREIEIADEMYAERTFVKYPGEESDSVMPLEPRTIDDTTVYVAFEESDRGSDGPFYVAYTDEDREERYGYFCGNCDSLDIAMDSMGRVVCNDCGNKRKPSRWDASYL